MCQQSKKLYIDEKAWRKSQLLSVIIQSVKEILQPEASCGEFQNVHVASGRVSI